ncbi:DUF2914 domain-containing protein [Pseudomonas sp. FW306-02-F02-AA]|uniref:DUF2914 domain-containing protein n=1 Tax=Pseudomonas fluorescens TaxID=294 RepID=A0A0N9WUB9_PSEFL|nr:MULTISPECIES: DUF5924 family protein [Pseudomonas]ALI01581.1 hypothetical protein AO353_11020 [Pseudomonas fluorescens]PMZ05702.1 DUF2914 domain-containing protein [Pseudomonas sp. FW306-02-F02-AB]PMZ11272.1 DUF2914 domain-containing protein [Pseudomonas sp. FW306-02-H06C]PMZ17195.1 DUF2914 domain-containing protein [Pseudomonas sp. FW306-02-F02-AA]PMZ22912.1 DUF2914 domain-containing protein [Pseudomonas sp. FW306-02-F08-AA]
MPILTHYVTRILELMKRYPGVIALGGFISGVCSFILVDRQQSLATWIATIMLVSWLWLMLENSLTELFTKVFKREIPQPLLRYATQMIHQESLFFVLPFFFITTTWNSGQLVFTGLLGAAALVSITDPLYYKWLAPRRWLFLAMHTLTLFAALLTALPIILNLTTAQSFKLALGTAMLLSFPSLASIFPIRTIRGALSVLSITLAIGCAGWLLRSWVPPATLWMTQVAISTQLQDRTPGDSHNEVSVAQLRPDGLYAYTAINAPRGLDERIYHVWQFNGQEVDRIALDIHGGRKEGYRAWSHKQNFPGNPAGDWQVRVLTEDGQVIGVLRFEVTDASQNGTTPSEAK